MKRNICLITILVLTAVSGYGQDRTVWRTAADVRSGSSGTIVGTVVDVDEARRQVQLEPDENSYQRVTVTSDSVSTRYYGFGGVINGSPEIYTGSTGFANIRVGDRLEVRGSARSNAVLLAEQMTLKGRPVDASQVGVGTTRPPTSVSTPTATSAIQSGTGSSAYTTEGTVRQINLNGGRIVIQTNDRRMITVRATRTTPVYYRSEVYRLDNLEIGDRVRVETDGRSTATDDITARTIDVIQSVQETPSTTTTDRRVTSLVGRVTRTDRSADTIRVDNGRTEIRVDMSRASDAQGRAIHADEIRVGDQVDVSGSYSSSQSDLFLASTLRYADSSVFGSGTTVAVDRDNDVENTRGDYVIVTMSGTVTESLDTSPVLVVRDRANGRNVEVWVTDDFPYRTKAGSYTTADKLKVGDPILIKAFRDENNNLIAQTIRGR